MKWKLVVEGDKIVLKAVARAKQKDVHKYGERISKRDRGNWKP